MGPGVRRRPARISLFVGPLGWATVAALGAIALAVVPSANADSPVFSAVGGPAPLLASSSSSVLLTSSAQPGSICADNASGCAAGTGTARITLSAQWPTVPEEAWPDVQVAFAVETTPYDGVFDHGDLYGLDPCGPRDNPLCEESNGVPFFIANAQTIATRIAAANPHSNVTFSMVDYFGTDRDWNDGPQDSWKYHVDLPTFVPAAQFAAAVATNFQAAQLTSDGGWACECGMDDNILHSSSITALYGAIVGSGLDWSSQSHHVIVLLGSTAPRAPGYQQEYWVSASIYNTFNVQYPEYSGTCEPAYGFPGGASPNCEGWVVSQDGNPGDSIAALTQSAPACVNSIGQRCIVDVIDYWTTSTDPYSLGWPTHSTNPFHGGGPGGQTVLQNTARVLEAGCDLAAATGGTWDGPGFWSCPNGATGTLQYVPHGPIASPNTYNPSLLDSLSRIGFGPIEKTLVANGSSRPLFTYVPPPNFHVASPAEFRAACEMPMGFLPTCQQTPTVSSAGGLSVYGWNWSSDPAQNALHVGDRWSVSFNVVNSGPPYAYDPVLECATSACRAAGAAPLSGPFSQVAYLEPNTTSLLTVSFPLTSVRVIGPPLTAPGAGPPPPAPTIPPALPAPANPTPPIPLPTPTPVFGSGVAALSMQALGAGTIAAGFTRIAVKGRPIAVAVAAKAGPLSRFEPEDRRRSGLGRWE